MFGLGPATRIYLAGGATDMRKGFEGLYGLARDRLLCDPLSGHVFLFSNARHTRLKGWRKNKFTDWVRWCSSTWAEPRAASVEALGVVRGLVGCQ